MLENTRFDYFQNKPIPNFKNVFPIFNVIFSGFVKKHIQKFTDDLFKNLYAINSVLLKSSYSEYVKSVMVGIHRNLKVDIAHNEVLLFLGIASNEYNNSIIFNDFSSMCSKINDDLLYLFHHYVIHSRCMSYMKFTKIYRKLRRTEAGVLLYSEFGYSFQCDELDGIYN